VFAGVLLFRRCIRRSLLAGYRGQTDLLLSPQSNLTPLHFVTQYVTAMIGLFGEASDRLCQNLDKAASDGEDVEMESLFSRLTLDVIGKAVFNYDFDSLSYDNGIVEVNV
jgi:hypothetical protein